MSDIHSIFTKGHDGKLKAILIAEEHDINEEVKEEED